MKPWRRWERSANRCSPASELVGRVSGSAHVTDPQRVVAGSGGWKALQVAINLRMQLHQPLLLLTVLVEVE
jgi:hypothetical protein